MLLLNFKEYTGTRQLRIRPLIVQGREVRQDQMLHNFTQRAHSSTVLELQWLGIWTWMPAGSDFTVKPKHVAMEKQDPLLLPPCKTWISHYDGFSYNVKIRLRQTTLNYGRGTDNELRIQYFKCQCIFYPIINHCQFSF